MLTMSEAIEKSQEDYKKALGSIIEVDCVFGNIEDDSVEVFAPSGAPFKVRILPTHPDDLRPRLHDYLDPFWSVEVIEGTAEAKGLSTPWTYGPSYQVSP